MDILLFILGAILLIAFLFFGTYGDGIGMFLDAGPKSEDE